MQKTLSAGIGGTAALRPSTNLKNRVTQQFREAGPADGHIRVMEECIKAQRALVDDLDRSGKDTSAAVRRLTLLLSTLKEMRVQLALLAETEMDKKNGRADVLVSRLLGKGVA